MAGAVRGQGQEVLRLPSMSKLEVEELLKNSRICRLAFNDMPQPYIIPLDYVYMNGKMYFHFAGYGKKISLFEKDPHVSVEVDRYNDDITEYESVTLMGTLAKVTDMGEKMAVSKKLLESIKSRGGEKNVAARHGYERLDLDTLMSESSMVLRLDVADYVALKSPAS
ncbi:putative flavin-nucleotide-binding protein [Methanocella conradii HZ254]|uniref:Flavin-nucleotide-binding protein n=1 Tax=Methanocella conradii (strain DSM 24694 / JCM 17849 / CGMCC 1.5162 / HZ254) TaxID=1041930 RepID=H8I4Y2_METCZ|nr:pyridoxamine 5'-phosphate oxidase family protein [Methanocella conradii]AFD01076.1 putative flavin-nucleotide-binding protein [Methanocella conradii HZ254]MDI6897835.1 pyridoxamine 5'-phosphate oxidase family protein [Methanocella conradii]